MNLDEHLDDGTSNTRDGFSAYASAIDRIRRDSGADQAALLHKAKGDSPAALRAYQELWTQASKLVLYVHGKMKRQGKLPTVAYDDMDAIQEANVAVGHALMRWDPTKGTLATWLVPQIRGALLDYANTHLNAGIGSKHVSVTRVGLDEQVDSEEVSSAQDEPGMEQSVGITREESLTYSDDVIPAQHECLQRHQIESAIYSMSQPHGTIAWEHYILGMDIADIANFRDISAQTVRRYMHEANVYIRNRLYRPRANVANQLETAS